MQGIAGEENLLSIFLASASALPWQGTAEEFDATISTVPPTNVTAGEKGTTHHNCKQTALPHTFTV